MNIKQVFYKICEKLGKNNKATYAVVAIATAKGLFRPIFTMMDKHESPETKKYTALREGLTEFVAIPTYIGVAKLAEKIVTSVKTFKNDKLEIAKHNANFLGVCIAAVFVIPMVTSMIINPIMNLINKNGKNKPQNASGNLAVSNVKNYRNNEEVMNIQEFGRARIPVQKTHKTNLNDYYNSKPSEGTMKVGGI